MVILIITIIALAIAVLGIALTVLLAPRESKEEAGRKVSNFRQWLAKKIDPNKNR